MPRHSVFSRRGRLWRGRGFSEFPHGALQGMDRIVVAHEIAEWLFVAMAERFLDRAALFPTENSSLEEELQLARRRIYRLGAVSLNSLSNSNTSSP